MMMMMMMMSPHYLIKHEATAKTVDIFVQCVLSNRLFVAFAKSCSTFHSSVLFHFVIKIRTAILWQKIFHILTGFYQLYDSWKIIICFWFDVIVTDVINSMEKTFVILIALLSVGASQLWRHQANKQVHYRLEYSFLSTMV